MKAPPCGDHEAAGHHGVAGPFQYRVGLAGEQRLVDLQVVGLGDRAVHDGLVAGAQLDEVAEDDLGGGDLGRDPVAAHRGFRLADHREAVQGLLGPPLLDDADAGVGDDHEAEEAVLDRRDEQHDQPEHADDQVEPGEDVGADDLADGAGRADGYVVDLAAGDPLGDLGGGQPAWVHGRGGQLDRVDRIELGPGVDHGRTRMAGGAACFGGLLAEGMGCPLRHGSDGTGGWSDSPTGRSEDQTGGGGQWSCGGTGRVPDP